MKIGFVGCGAIGSCYASYLSREHEVCVLDTYAPVIESIKKNGILVDECVPGTGTGETVVFHPAMATTDPKEIGVVDLLISLGSVVAMAGRKDTVSPVPLPGAHSSRRMPFFLMDSITGA